MFGALGNVGTMRAFLTLDYSQYMAAMKSANRLNKEQMAANVANMNRYHTRLGMAATGLVAGIAPMMMLTDKIQKTFADYEKFSSKIQVVSKLTNDQLAKLNQQLNETGKAYGVRPTEMMQAGYVAAQATYTKLSEMSEVAKKSAELSLASGWEISTEASADSLTRMMQSFGFSINMLDQMNDTLVKTRDVGNVSMNELADAISNVSAIYAQAFPQDKWKAFQEMMTMFASGTLGGLKPSTMGYALRNVIMRSYAESKRPNSGLNIWAQQKGYRDAADMMKGGLMPFLRDIQEFTGGYMERAAMLGYRQREIAGIATLLRSGMGNTEEAYSAITSSKGSSVAAQERMRKTWQFIKNELKAVQEAWKLSFGQIVVYYLAMAVSALKKFLLWCEKIPDAAKHFIVWGGILLTLITSLKIISALLGIIGVRSGLIMGKVGGLGLLGTNKKLASAASKMIDPSFAPALQTAGLVRSFYNPSGKIKNMFGISRSDLKLIREISKENANSVLASKHYGYGTFNPLSGIMLRNAIPEYMNKELAFLQRGVSKQYSRSVGKNEIWKSRAMVRNIGLSQLNTGSHTFGAAGALAMGGIRGATNSVQSSSIYKALFAPVTSAAGMLGGALFRLSYATFFALGALKVLPIIFSDAGRNIKDSINFFVNEIVGNTIDPTVISGALDNFANLVWVGLGTSLAIIWDSISVIASHITAGAIVIGKATWAGMKAIGEFIHPTKTKPWSRVEYVRGSMASMNKQFRPYGGIPQELLNEYNNAKTLMGPEGKVKGAGSWAQYYVKGASLGRAESAQAAWKEELGLSIDTAKNMVKNSFDHSYLASLLGFNGIPFLDHPTNMLFRTLFSHEGTKGVPNGPKWGNPSNNGEEPYFPDLLQPLKDLREYASALEYGTVEAYNARLPAYQDPVREQLNVAKSSNSLLSQIKDFVAKTAENTEFEGGATDFEEGSL